MPGCNGNGRCIGCSCSKAGRPCTNCLPSRKGHCRNVSSTTPTRDNDMPSVPSHTLESQQQLQTDLRAQAVSPSPEQEYADDDATISDQEILAEAEFTIDTDPISDISAIPSLPQFKDMTCNQSAWHEISGEEFSKAIDEAYGQTVHWIPNSFMVPRNLLEN